jgi:hypothetical protein
MAHQAKKPKPKPLPTVTIAETDDWVGLYINGKLVHENHGITMEEQLDYMGVEYRQVFVSDDWMEKEGVSTFPDNEEDLPESE